MARMRAMAQARFFRHDAMAPVEPLARLLRISQVSLRARRHATGRRHVLPPPRTVRLRHEGL